MKRLGILLVLALVVLVLGCAVIFVVLPTFEQLGTQVGVSPAPTTGAGPRLQTAWYAVYFTDPQYPDDPKTHHGSLDAHLVDLIDKATKTLDVAIYDFDLANVAEAMVRAKERKVSVRMVTDSDTLGNTKDEAVQAAFAKLEKAHIPIVADGREAIMHDKFTVVDGEWVSTGSWNYTDGDTYRLNNNMIVIHSKALAANYTAEFEKMFIKRQFGASKPKGVPFPTLTVDDARMENYFAPQDNVADHVVATLQSAQKSIYFMAFSFTDDRIGEVVRSKAEAGLKVAGVFETTGSNTPYSEYGAMKKAGLEVYQDGNPYSMHHKVFILDEKTVIFGSFNFSESADRSNDENLLIVEQPELARTFKAEFDRVLARAKSK